MEVPRGFTRCDECEGTGIENDCRWANEDLGHDCDGCPCPSCSGSGLLPTEKLREEATVAARSMWGRSFADLADAVLAKVAEHIGEAR